MTIKIHEDIVQGSEEWYELRRGILTASEMKLIITPTLKTASNEKERNHLFELAAQRISGFVEPSYVSDDMIRGKEDEIAARELYAERYAPVQNVGFITNDKFGFVIGYSPDGLVGDDGSIEAKSRKQKYHLQTVLAGVFDIEYMIQVQTGLLVSERKWCDCISYCGGLPMFTVRVHPDQKVQDAIITAASEFEGRLRSQLEKYHALQNNLSVRLIPTERKSNLLEE